MKVRSIRLVPLVLLCTVFALGLIGCGGKTDAIQRAQGTYNNLEKVSIGVEADKLAKEIDEVLASEEVSYQEAKLDTRLIAEKVQNAYHRETTAIAANLQGLKGKADPMEAIRLRKEFERTYARAGNRELSIYGFKSHADIDEVVALNSYRLGDKQGVVFTPAKLRANDVKVATETKYRTRTIRVPAPAPKAAATKPATRRPARTALRPPVKSRPRAEAPPTRRR